MQSVGDNETGGTELVPLPIDQTLTLLLCYGAMCLYRSVRISPVHTQIPGKFLEQAVRIVTENLLDIIPHAQQNPLPRREIGIVLAADREHDIRNQLHVIVRICRLHTSVGHLLTREQMQIGMGTIHTLRMTQETTIILRVPITHGLGE